MDIKDIPGLGSILDSREALSKLNEFIKNLPGAKLGDAQTPLVPGTGSSFGKISISGEDIVKLKEFLKGLSESELDKIVKSQTHCITDQYLLVNREGSAFGRIFIDITVSTVNTQRFESAGYTLFKEKSFTGYLRKTVNYCTDLFWSCSCKDSYIHHRNQIQCKICGVYSSADTKKYTPINELELK